MNNIILPKEIKGEFQIESNGSSVTSIRGAARLAGVDEKALRYQFSPAEKSFPKLAQKLMDYGFDPAEFSTNGIGEVALSLILEFYSFDAGARCTEQARLVYKAFASVGIRTWLQQQLDYQPSTSSTVPHASQDLSTIEAIERIFSSIHKLPIKTELVESAKLTAIAKTIPHLANATEVGKQLLSC